MTIQLNAAITAKLRVEGKICLIFPCQTAAEECIAYATSKARGDMQMDQSELQLVEFEVLQHLWAVFFPVSNAQCAMQFWINPGLGISTRLAEDSLQSLDKLRIVSTERKHSSGPVPREEAPVYEQLRRRILQHMYRSPLEPSREQAASSDVYLYSNGMAAIYSIHSYITKEINQQSVVFSFPFHCTYHIFEDFGPGFKFYGRADEKDLADLTQWLETHYAEEKSIQTLFCEFPNNPIATAPDLTSLRKLADKYGFFLIVDDTIGSSCNVDLTSVADAIITSLTKSFSGYADVMGGSIVLNPSLPAYPRLKTIFDKYYHNHLYHRDAEILLSNSTDYLSRADIYHRNAAALVKYFSSLIDDAHSGIKKVYYPTTNPSLTHYQRFMRKSTQDVTPGYGALMSVEFHTMAQLIAFYNAVDFFKAPHLGAHVTLVLPYVKGLYGKQLEWAAQFDLRETQLRIAPGLEEEEELMRVMKEAMGAVRVAGEED